MKGFRWACALVGGSMIAAALPPAAGAADDSAGTIAPGTVSIPAFAYPPSALSSEAQKQAYARSLLTPGNGSITIPTDPKFIAKVRDFINQMFAPSVALVKERYPVTITNEKIGGVEVIRVRPKAGIKPENRKRVILDLHGGSFFVGWPSVALLDAVPVAALSGIEVITINYRMYPEATHPAALEDLTAVYKEVLKTHDARSIGIFGGSAGGVITLQSVPWFKAHGLPLPGAIAPLACGFQTAIGDSAIWNFNGGFSPPGTTLVEKAGYFGSRSRTDWVPETGPDKLAFYPPTLWMTGTRAPELSGAATGNARLIDAGVESQIYVIEGGWHSSYSTAPQTPESQAAMRYLARWFGEHLRR